MNDHRTESREVNTTGTTLAGVLPVIQTVFTSSGDIDVRDTQRELDWILDQGVAGLTTGMVSELLRLTESERRQLSELVVETCVRRRALSVVSCGAESTKTAISHALHAEAVGASAIMAIPPTTVALEDEEVFTYFMSIADAVDLPLVVQDASGYVGRSLSIDVQVRLLDRLTDRVYFKPEASPIGPRLSELRDSTGGAARVFEGSGGAALIDSFRRGVVGTMPGGEVCWAIQRLWEALGGEEWETAYTISGTLNSLVSLQSTIDSYVAVEKHLSARQGVIGDVNVRGPLGFRLDRETRDEVDRLYDLLRASV